MIRYPVDKYPVVVCDLDGTLCDATHRNHMLLNKPVDWEAYCQACDLDLPILATKALLQSLASHIGVIYLTGRKITSWSKTLRWLRDHDMVGRDQGELIMRPHGDHRPNEDFKLDQVRRLRDKYEVLFVIDDHPKVAEKIMGALGVPVLQVVSPSAGPDQWGLNWEANETL